MAAVYKEKFVEALKQVTLQKGETLGQKIEHSIGYLLNDNKNQVAHDTVQWLKGFSQEQQFALMSREMHYAGEAIRRGEPVLFLSVDDTPAGDAHHVSALYEPEKSIFSIEIPDEPSDIFAKDGQQYSRKGGRFPTVLHTVEMFVVAFKLAEKSAFSLRRELDGTRDITHPQLKFVKKEDEESLASRLHKYSKETLAIAITPLTYQPNTSNVLIFNKNAQGRDINPRAIAQIHYDAMQADAEIADVLLRHTMLLEGRVDGGNKVIEIGIMDGLETKQHKLFRTSRLDNSWREPIQQPVFLGEVLDSQNRIRRKYSLNPKESDSKK